jgi:hypothetical protein
LELAGEGKIRLMARKITPVSYDALTIGRKDPEPEVEAVSPDVAGFPSPPAPVAGELLKDIAQQYVIYLHPAAHKTIARYALEQSSFRSKVRPHDLIIQAIEEFFERNGLPGPVRAKPKEK